MYSLVAIAVWRLLQWKCIMSCIKKKNDQDVERWLTCKPQCRSKRIVVFVLVSAMAVKLMLNLRWFKLVSKQSVDGNNGYLAKAKLITGSFKLGVFDFKWDPVWALCEGVFWCFVVWFTLTCFVLASFSIVISLTEWLGLLCASS